jgi:hypothetical protein
MGFYRTAAASKGAASRRAMSWVVFVMGVVSRRNEFTDERRPTVARRLLRLFVPARLTAGDSRSRLE